MGEKRKQFPSSECLEVRQGCTVRSAIRGSCVAPDKSYRALTLPAPGITISGGKACWIKKTGEKPGLDEKCKNNSAELMAKNRPLEHFPLHNSVRFKHALLSDLHLGFFIFVVLIL